MKPSTLKYLAALTCLLACGLSTLNVMAQTATITPLTQNYWAGINTTNILGPGSNSVAFTSPDASVFNLSVSGQPFGLATVLSTNLATNTISLGLSLFVTNVAAGAYSLNIDGSGGSYSSYSTNVNFFVVPQWVQTNNGSIGNWSDGTKWSGGAAPLTTEGVYIDHTIVGPWTNVVDSSRTIQSLVCLGTPADAGVAAAVNTTIAPGAKLSILGTNGFHIGMKQNVGNIPTFTFQGDTLLVSNTAADFTINSSNPNGTRYLRTDMSGLGNLQVYVNRLAIADISASKNSPDGQTLADFVMAQTNIIKATLTDDYNKAVFNTAISYMREDLSVNNGQSANAQIRLGYDTKFYADSVGVGIGNAPGSGSTAFSSTIGYRMVFRNPSSIAPTNSVLFRNTDGVSRMSLLAIGVDQGLTTAFTDNRGIVDLQGGKVDMLVDKIWLGQDRTNSANANGKVCIGGLYFNWGTVDCNTLVAGNMKYTNNVPSISGYVLVGTNGILTVNTNLILGQTPADVTGFEAQAAAVSGQIRIDNGGTIRANKITVGQFSTNNVITVNVGGLLVVSNTIADTNKGLTTLTLDGAQLTFSVLAGITNAYVTNLNTTTTASKINIASAPLGQYTNVLMVYQAANQTPNIGIGTLPPGFNNMQIVVDTVAKTVNLVVSTNQPKNLAWRGGQNSQWDHASLNWLDTNSLAITKFTDGDSVIFDDTTGVPTNITISETVNPGQSGTGILVVNTTNSFTFNNSGAGSIGSCTLVKTGTNSLQIDATTSVGALVNGGILSIGSSGSIANATTDVGTTLNNSGTISGGVTCAGTLQNPGSINGSLSLQTSASAVNSGTVSGALAMQSGTFLNNLGNLSAIGSTTVATNSTLINAGTIYGSSLTVAIGGTLTDTVPGSSGVSAGSINVGTLTINGTFNPGGTGNAIGTTKVTDYNFNGDQTGSPNGRIQLNAGSVTIFKVNTTNTQPYTKLLSQSQVFGPSGSAKAINGCTLLISNVGPTAFTAGQTFKLFGQYYSDGNMGNAGLNSTNTYPIIAPQTPGAGLAWDLSQLYPGGVVGVISASSVQITLTNTTAIFDGTNIVTHLSWPADFIGSGWVQQQLTTLTNGLGTNWNNVGQSDYVNEIYLTNQIDGSPAVFYRFVRP